MQQEILTVLQNLSDSRLQPSEVQEIKWKLLQQIQSKKFVGSNAGFHENTSSEQQLMFRVIAMLYCWSEIGQEKSKQSSIKFQESEQKIKTQLLKSQKIKELIHQYQGPYSTYILKLYYSIFQHINNGENSKLSPFTTYLIKWNESIKSKLEAQITSDFKLHKILIEDGLPRGIVGYEDMIIFLNFIAKDLIGHLQIFNPTKNASSNEDLLKFLKAILPKTLSNVIVSRELFPRSLLTLPDEDMTHIDLLYSNQMLENIVRMCGDYQLLVLKILQTLLKVEEQPVHFVKQIVSQSLKYYILYHSLGQRHPNMQQRMEEEKEVINQKNSPKNIVFHSFRKMNSSVRFALNQQISIFLNIINKLGDQKFIDELKSQFEWISELKTYKNPKGIAKQAIVPFHNRAIASIPLIKVAPRSSQRRYIEIYDRFSILFFSIKCIEYDIGIKFYYLGNFDKPLGVRQHRLIFSSEKDDLYEGSLQAIETGIYMFEFDNTFSWIHQKVIAYDVCVLVPLQFVETDRTCQPLKNVIFSELNEMNKCPINNILGWIHHKEIKYYTGVANVIKKAAKIIEQNKVPEFYNIRISYNTNKIYEFQSDNLYLFLSKVQEIGYISSQSIIWKIQGYNLISEVQNQKIRLQLKEEQKKDKQNVQNFTLFYQYIKKYLTNQYHPRHNAEKLVTPFFQNINPLKQFPKPQICIKKQQKHMEQQVTVNQSSIELNQLENKSKQQAANSQNQ